MKGNKGKEVSGGARLEAEPQVRSSTGDKRKTLSKNLDLENLPSRRSKKTRHGSSQLVKSNPPPSHQPAQVFDVDSSTLVETTPSQTPPSKLTLSTSSQPSQKVSSNIIENESLAWERFKNAVTEEDINTCYDMSLKDFEHSGVHDLFKVTSLPCLY